MASAPPSHASESGTVDRDVATLLASLAAAPTVDPCTVPVETRRAQLEKFALIHGGSAPRIRRIDDLSIPGVAGECYSALPLRVYYAYGVPDEGMPLQPAYIALHGGGHNAGSLASHDTMCRELAIASGAIVCALEYRLAPRDVAPAPVLDAVCAFTWVAKHAVKLGVDARRLGIVGDSAGGNLAAAACVKLTAGGAAAAAGVPSPRSLVLLYPFLDLTLAPSPTYERYGEGFYLRLPAIRHYVNMYLGRVTEDDGTDAAHEAESRPYVVDPRDPLVSPLHASEEQLAALPPTAIFTAECDPIRSDGEAFAARLAAAGVKHTYTCHAGMIHAYLLLGGTVRAVADLFTEIGEAMAAAVAAEPDA